MQDRYIESLRSDYQKLEKENGKMENDITETLNHMNASIDILGTEINKIHKHNHKKITFEVYENIFKKKF